MGNKNNQGFSLIELMVVIAIMAVVTGMVSFSLAFLFGTDAKQAAEKISAQLSETKTGAMSRYDEAVTFSYQTKDPAKAIPGDGYYAEHRTFTIANTDTVVKENTIGEIRKIASSRVTITLYGQDGSSLELGTTHSVTISYDRSSGAMEKAVIDGNTAAPVMLEKIVVQSGHREYTIAFTPQTGKHVIE